MQKRILNNFDDTAKLHATSKHLFDFNRIMGINKPIIILNTSTKINLPVDKVADAAREAIASKKQVTNVVQQKLKAYDHKPGHIIDIKG